MALLKGFRDYSEHDVLNLFSYKGSLSAVSGWGHIPAGTLVEIENGVVLNEGSVPVTEDLGFSFNNTVSSRYGVSATVKVNDGNGSPLGILLMDVRETDENGEKLIFNPRKAAEINAVVKGQPVPVLTRGVAAIEVLDNIISPATAEEIAANPTLAGQSVARPSFAGYAVYATNSGKLQTNAAGQKVGILLSTVSNGVALVKFDFNLKWE
jgi:hypothetical protein